ncbi:MAG: hypothetical protein JNL10_18845 [Verrucomicrobiales bacterium]|nr:hypothetical protein [Verrucomicrobiales bacterium]
MDHRSDLILNLSRLRVLACIAEGMARALRTWRSRGRSGAWGGIAWIGVWLLLAGIMPGRAVPWEDLSKEYVLRKFTVEDGLPQNSVTKIVQTPEGYLWCSTYRGLVRFDGVRFTVFDNGNTRAIQGDNTVEAMHCDRNGRLAVVMKGGELLWVENGRVTRGNGTSGLPDGPLGMRGESPDGSLHLAVPDSSAWYRETPGGSFVPTEPQRAVSVRSFDDVLVDIDGTPWYRDRGTAVRMDAMDLLPLLAATESSIRAVWLVARSRRGGVWMVTDQGVRLWEDHGWKRRVPSSDSFGACTGALEDSAGNLWVGTWNHGLWRLDPEGRYHAYPIGRSARPESVRALFEDAERNVWIGTEASGLWQLSRRVFRTIGAAEGMASEIVRSVTEGADGRIWVSTQAGLESFNPDPQPVPVLQTAADNLWCVRRDSGGNLWVGDYGGGVFLREPDRTRIVEPGSGEKGRPVTLFFEEPGQGMWVGRENGLWRASGTGLVREPLPGSAPEAAVRSMALDRQSRLWLGLGGGGLLCREAGKWTCVPIPGVGSSISVSTLLVDSEGTLWVGTAGRGYFRFRDGMFTPLQPERIGLPRWPSSMVEDESGFLWIGSSDGIFRMSREGLHAWADEPRTGPLPRRFAVEDGLETSECSVNIQPAVWRGRDQRLWFATSKGVSVVDPRQLRPNSVPPSTVIEDVSLDGVPVFSNGPSGVGRGKEASGDPEIVVPAGRQRIEIRYTGLSLVAPERVRFRHRLEESDAAWEEDGTRRVATYHRLAPGRYHFQVVAANNDGIWDPKGADLQFRVLPEWWQTGSFRAALAFLLTGGVLGAYRARVRSLTQARRVQEEFSRRLIASQEAERQRIARELHDSLGQNLLVIKSRVALAQQQAGRPEKLADQLGEAAAMASNALREVREISQNLRPYQLDELGLTKAIGAMVRKLAAASPIRFTTDLAELRGVLPPEFEINLYRIVQESLNNVVKHSGADECSVTVTRDEHRIVVRVRDDGCGFEWSEPSDGAPSREGFGLSSLRERARTMSAQVRFDARPGEGTCVTVSVPLQR